MTARVSGRQARAASRCLIVAPHPDDETIGTGVWMDRNRHLSITVLHLTDGSPRDAKDAKARGFTRRAYAAARRRELHNSVAILRMRVRLRVFGYVDKETYLHLHELTRRLAALIDRLQPLVVLSPAYEGGHPDHDSAAFATAMARQLVTTPFRHREYQLYHAGPLGEMVTGAFISRREAPPETILLSHSEQRNKRRMLASFKTQAAILRNFSVSAEGFRDAPSYDFTAPPHDGTLLYERWALGVTGEQWRQRARQAICDIARETSDP